jgi:hypothetical protein
VNDARVYHWSYRSRDKSSVAKIIVGFEADKARPRTFGDRCDVVERPRLIDDVLEKRFSVRGPVAVGFVSVADGLWTSHRSNMNVLDSDKF